MQPSTEAHARLAAVWAFRAHAELGAQARFDALSRALRRCGDPDALARAVAAAHDDERRHEALCRGLADALGGAPAPPDGDLEDLASPGWDAYQRVTFALVAGCCVTESINAAVLGATLARCDHAPVRAVVRALLRDEVRHAQLGWAQLERARDRIALDFVGPWIPRVFEQTFRPGFFQDTAPSDAATEALGDRWGVLPKAASVEVVRAVVAEAVLPGLARAGIDTAPALAWWTTHGGPSTTA